MSTHTSTALPPSNKVAALLRKEAASISALAQKLGSKGIAPIEAAAASEVVRIASALKAAVGSTPPPSGADGKGGDGEADSSEQEKAAWPTDLNDENSDTPGWTPFGDGDFL